MIRFHEIKTQPIDAAAFRSKAVAQGWQENIVYDLMSRLLNYKTPFVIDAKGKVYISNHYRFDVLDIDLEEEFFDWYPTPDGKDGDYIN